MNLFSASVFHSYGRIMKDLDVLDEKREAKALSVAWYVMWCDVMCWVSVTVRRGLLIRHCLDYDKKGYITQERFSRLIGKLKPHSTKFEVSVLFKLMDPSLVHLLCWWSFWGLRSGNVLISGLDGNGTIEPREFSDGMIDCLYGLVCFSLWVCMAMTGMMRSGQTQCRSRDIRRHRTSSWITICVEWVGICRVPADTNSSSALPRRVGIIWCCLSRFGTFSFSSGTVQRGAGHFRHFLEIVIIFQKGGHV